MSPPNVLITKYGEMKIVDFGLAKASSQLEKSEPGIIKGKFSYLSPEAALGQDVDQRTDIFAVGIILWEMLAGQRLFLGETDFETVKLVQQAVVPPLSKVNPKVPPELERIVEQGARARSGPALPDRARARRRAQRVPLSLRQGRRQLRHRDARAVRDQGSGSERARAALDHRQADRGGALRVHLAARGQRDRHGDPGSRGRRGCRSFEPRQVPAGARLGA